MSGAVRLDGIGGAAHPLEESGRLAWQATAAVGLLERFGDLLMVALDAVGQGDDDVLDAALAERERLVAQLEPLLAALAGAREAASGWSGIDAALRAEVRGAAASAMSAVADAAGAVSASRAAIAVILRPVDEALRHAQHLHLRLADEVRDRTTTAVRRCGAPIVLVP